MQNRMLLLLILAAAVTAISCGSEPTVAAAGGAPSAGSIPVGPLPGPPQTPSTPVNPFADSRVAAMEGRQLFVKYNCSGCHGGHAGGGMGPSLRDPVWIYGGSDAHIFDSIAQGRGKGMPAWGTMLPGEQIWKLVAYIKTLRTPQEVEPPE